MKSITILALVAAALAAPLDSALEKRLRPYSHAAPVDVHQPAELDKRLRPNSVAIHVENHPPPASEERHSPNSSGGGVAFSK